MQLRNKLLAAAFAGLAMIGSNSNAATVQYTLDLTVDNTWKVFVDVSDGDNFGLALASFQFAGQTLTHDNISPRSTAPSSGGGEPSGFTLLRTGDNANAGTTENNQTISSSQDTTIVPNPNLVYGFGQEASSFVLEGVTPGGITEQPVWTEPLLLAQGTYNRLLNPGLTINMASGSTFVNVFSQADDPGDEVNPTVETVPNANESLIRLPFVDNTPPSINDVVLPGPYNANEPGEPQTLQQQMTATDTQQPLCAGCTWDQLVLQSYTPNYGGEGPVPAGNNNPNVNPNLSGPTGLFTWITEGTPRGDYVWSMRTTDAGGLSDTGTLSIAVTHVPEPASVALFGLALAGIFGLVRRTR